MSSPAKKFSATWGLLFTAGIVFITLEFCLINAMSSYVKLTNFAGIGLLLNGRPVGGDDHRPADAPRERNWLRPRVSCIYSLYSLFTETPF